MNYLTYAVASQRQADLRRSSSENRKARACAGTSPPNRPVRH
jgi:hypothetical protein